MLKVNLPFLLRSSVELADGCLISMRPNPQHLGTEGGHELLQISAQVIGQHSFCFGSLIYLGPN